MCETYLVDKVLELSEEERRAFDEVWFKGKAVPVNPLDLFGDLMNVGLRFQKLLSYAFAAGIAYEGARSRALEEKRKELATPGAPR